MKNLKGAKPPITFTQVYHQLYRHYGPQHWWPANTAFEMMVGAILTQNTSWRNVEKAIQKLREHRMLNPQAIDKSSKGHLTELIKSTGYYNVKAKRLKNLTNFLKKEFSSDIKKMKPVPLAQLRPQLLSVNGIGPETADSVLLYALGKAVFVVDVYTRRVFSRIGLLKFDMEYEMMARTILEKIPRSIKLYNEYHALLVAHAKRHCKNKPLCVNCVLAQQCFFCLRGQS